MRNPPRRRSSRTRFRFVLVASAIVVLAASCQTAHRKQGVTGRQEMLAQRDGAIAQLKEEKSRLAKQLAEKEALNKQLEQWLLSQQRMLDEAIQEVVRIQAKQRSLESRAEAASEMAEAEIALKSLRDRTTETNRPELANAEQLLTRATREFEAQNFGGALYLVRQAKGQIKSGSMRLGKAVPAKQGETEMPYAIPLPLRVGARGNLREGPGVEFKVLATIEAGSRVKAFFTKGAWLRVETEDGQSGWIHRVLVSSN